MEYTIETVKYTFRYGRFLPKHFFVLFFSMFGGLLFMLACVLIYCIVGQQGSEEIIGICCVALIPFVIIAITLIVMIVQRRRKKIVARWLLDDQLIERRVIPFIVSQIGGRSSDPVQIAIKFRCGDRKLTKVSKKHSAGFQALAYKEITILYSPRYDQVMVLG